MESSNINPLNKVEKYKIFEYFDFSIIEPNNGKYEYCMVFFAGFNENASKYIYLFKLFFENFEPFQKIKIIIPMLNRVTKDDYKNAVIPRDRKKDLNNLYSWFIVFKDELSDSGYKITSNPQKDLLVKKLVSDEVKKLGSSEKIIFAGFSMGGRYLLKILTEMKIKTMFNIILKTVVFLYDNPYLNGESEEDRKFNDNNLHCYYSRYDKIVQFDNISKSFQILKRVFPKTTIRIDNNKKHIVDFNCLEYLRILLMQYLITNGKF